MTGDYTAVPLRRDDRWTAARMQQGRVLLDHEWNLNADADARRSAHAMRDVVGPAGVVEGSDAFRVSVLGSTPRDLLVQPGRMWVDGWEAFAPASFRYAEQAQVAPIGAGRVLAFLDVFLEHVQPSERPGELVDPAIAPVESCARARVGYRVRVAPTTATTCTAAFAALGMPSESTGRLTIDSAAPTTTTDPCDPPGDPLGLLPEGLFRVEVLDGGSRSNARFAWSVENGAASVAVRSVAGDTVTLEPSASVKFSTDELVEVSWLARRADRLPHGALYRVVNPSSSAAGDVLTLDRAVTAPAGADGLVVRRWDGEVVGPVAAVAATIGPAATDLGLRFTAGDGTYLAGDWWGARLRSGAAPGVERRVAAAPDGIAHAFAPLALLDLDAGTVLHDCRPRFRSLVDVDGAGTCTVTVFPGDDLQVAVDSLPPSGGEVCVAAGEHVVREPVRIANRRRVVVTGVGPATVLRSVGSETVLLFDRSSDVAVRHLRVVGDAGATEGEGIGGALTFLRCSGIAVDDCEVACPDASVRDQACVVVRGSDDEPSQRVSVTGNTLEIGTWQTGVLVTDAADAYVARNQLRHVPTGRADTLLSGRQDVVVHDLARAILASSGVTSGRMRLAEMATARRAAPLTSEYREHESGLPRPPRSRLSEIRKFLRATLRPDAFERLSATTRSGVLAFVSSLAAAGQGIVVAGTTVGTVRVHDNVVENAIQGIHVGASHARRSGREQAREVVVSRNVVHSRVPASYTRERHGVFVGNARSVHVTDTVATLVRPGLFYGGTLDKVDGIRVHGVLGPFVLVRQSSLEGFSTGVRVCPVAPVPDADHRMWLVDETMAAGAGQSIDAPAGLAGTRNFR
ncbi:MAG TPA: hypothetical protein VGX28_09445 [Frankiaceae bacterium]|jgi:hypothetical protein|nr:hypothetical protein [Frankiaceae bacterium]